MNMSKNIERKTWIVSAVAAAVALVLPLLIESAVAATQIVA
jgi:hypothetical protein